MTAGALLTVFGLALWAETGNFVVIIMGVLAVVTSLVERSYGVPHGRPQSANWRPTDERFIDPESGQLVTVWFDPSTGKRRYVADGDTSGTRAE